MTIKVGEPIPEGEFGYIAVTDSDPLEACQLPGKVKTEDWKGKKVVIFAVYVAFFFVMNRALGVEALACSGAPLPCTQT